SSGQLLGVTRGALASELVDLGVRRVRSERVAGEVEVNEGQLARDVGVDVPGAERAGVGLVEHGGDVGPGGGAELGGRRVAGGVGELPLEGDVGLVAGVVVD